MLTKNLKGQGKHAKKIFQLIKLRYFPNLVSIRGQNDGSSRSIKLYKKEVTRYESVPFVAGKICVRLVKPGFT